MSKVGAIDPESMRVFAFWGSILVLKLFGVLLLIARQRFTKKIFLNPEDAKFVKGSKVVYNDPDIERCRRAHLNDLENILPWFMMTYLWLTTGPATWLAALLIKTFVIARIIHTLVYAVVPQQPLRALSFFVGLGITIFQTLCTLWHYA